MDFDAGTGRAEDGGEEAYGRDGTDPLVALLLGDERLGLFRDGAVRGHLFLAADAC